MPGWNYFDALSSTPDWLFEPRSTNSPLEISTRKRHFSSLNLNPRHIQTPNPLTSPPLFHLSKSAMRPSVSLPRLLSARALSRRALSTTPRHAAASPFKTAPSPPRLPKEEQEIFEQLQKASTGAFSTPKASSDPSNSTPTASELKARINQSPASDSGPEETIRVEAAGEGEELHPNLRRGAPPEFEGDVNPKTGEVGGPKNEPLRWGHQGDWSYNGRVTDF